MIPEVAMKAAAKYDDPHVIFHGGEPTIRGESFLRDCAAVFGPRTFSIQSNLMELPPWLPAFANDVCDGAVGTSFDVYRIAKKAVLLGNIRKLSADGIRVTCNITISDNLPDDQLDEFLVEFAAAGGTLFWMQPMSPVNGRGVSPDRYAQAFTRYAAHPLNKTAARIASASSICGTWINGGNCAKNGTRTIEYDGTVYVCPDFAGQRIFALGNIGDPEFDDGPGNAANVIFYEREMNRSLECSDDCWQLCRGGCVAHTFFSGRDAILDRDPLCDAYRRIFKDAAE